MRALDVLELDASCSADDVKASFRRLAKANHPDVNKDAEAALRFQQVQAAYDVLRKAEERRAG